MSALSHLWGNILKKPDVVAPTLAAPLEPVTEEIVAWRGWSLHAEANARLDWVTGRPASEPFLKSVSREAVWSGPSFVADCLPCPENDRGIYAVTREAIRQVMTYSPLVIGEVALSGIVVCAEHGYRAERCVIRSLWLLPTASGTGQSPFVNSWGCDRKAFCEALETRYAAEVTDGRPAWVPAAPPAEQLYSLQQAYFSQLSNAYGQQIYGNASGIGGTALSSLVFGGGR